MLLYNHLIHLRMYFPSREGRTPPPALVHKAAAHMQETSLSSFKPLQVVQIFILTPGMND
jgi:hypothetical protein